MHPACTFTCHILDRLVLVSFGSLGMNVLVILGGPGWGVSHVACRILRNANVACLCREETNMSHVKSRK